MRTLGISAIALAVGLAAHRTGPRQWMVGRLDLFDGRKPLPPPLSHGHTRLCDHGVGPDVDDADRQVRPPLFAVPILTLRGPLSGPRLSGIARIVL